MNPPPLRERVRRYLAELGGPREVADDVDLFGTGALKSMQLMELINHLEDTYGLQVEERDVMTGRLRSVVAIAALVAERGAWS